MNLVCAGRSGDQDRDLSTVASGTSAWAIEDALDGALTTTGAEIAEVFLREADGSGVSMAGFRGPFADAFNEITHFEEGQGYPGLVVWQNRPLKVADATDDARFLRRRVKVL
ncbi:MAG: hypothetical protein JO359_10640 [Candidatus Eremiobacteraeota bacterium]|nr:hypothetical protein [Candidatus Eremiobacteraeota bacterium]